MSTQNVENLLVGAGYMYYAPLGTAEPADDQVHQAPGAGWTNLGWTDGGITVAYSPEFFEKKVDQMVDVLGSVLTGREFMFSANLAETTLDNYERLVNAGTSATGTAASGVDYQTFDPSDNPIGEPTYFMVLFDGEAPGGYQRRVIIRKALQVGEISSSYVKDGLTLYPAEFKAHYVSSSTRLFHIVDQTGAPA